jgi:death-on-curing protein
VRYVTVEEVLQINEDILGPASKVRDAGLLAAAVGRPELIVFGADAYPTLFDKVAALMESISLNHAFMDGNKRTAVVAAIHLLNWNGYDLLVDQMELVNATMSVVEHHWDQQKLAEWIEEHAYPFDFSSVEDIE